MTYIFIRVVSNYEETGIWEVVSCLQKWLRFTYQGLGKSDEWRYVKRGNSLISGVTVVWQTHTCRHGAGVYSGQLLCAPAWWQCGEDESCLASAVCGIWVYSNSWILSIWYFYVCACVVADLLLCETGLKYVCM